MGNDEHGERNKPTRLRRSKKYTFNAWKALKETTVPITWGELAELAPPIHQQVREGLGNAKPEHKIVEVCTANMEDEVSEESEQEEKHKYTSAFATCQIRHKIANVIIDTGSGICLCSKLMLNLLGWNI